MPLQFASPTGAIGPSPTGAIGQPPQQVPPADTQSLRDQIDRATTDLNLAVANLAQAGGAFSQVVYSITVSNGVPWITVTHV